jgi:predicted dehydrogenase
MDTIATTTSFYPGPPLLEITPDTACVKIGLVGYGYWGPKLVRNFHSLPASQLRTLCDLREDRLAEVQTLYPDLAVTRNYQELLSDDLDAIVIATPVHTHYRLVKAALLAGKHVLVEKPITARSDQGQELVELAAERELTLMVGHTFLYNPAVEAVREVVRSGGLGKIYYLNSTRANLGLLQPDINVMWDLGPHDISILRYVLDADPISVSARGAVYINTWRGLPEVVYMVLTFEGGIIANLRLSWLDPVKQRRLTIVGSQKMLVYDDVEDNKVVIYDKGVEVPPYSTTEEEFRASYRHGGEHFHPVNWTEPLGVECMHFVDCIRTKTCPRSNGEAGVAIVKVLETAQRSLRNKGVELEIEY